MKGGMELKTDNLDSVVSMGTMTVIQSGFLRAPPVIN